MLILRVPYKWRFMEMLSQVCNPSPPRPMFGWLLASASIIYNPSSQRNLPSRAHAINHSRQKRKLEITQKTPCEFMFWFNGAPKKELTTPNTHTHKRERHSRYPFDHRRTYYSFNQKTSMQVTRPQAKSKRRTCLVILRSCTSQ